MDFLQTLFRKINYAAFIVRGKKPWSLGYQVYKEKHIKNVLSHGKFDAEKLLPGYGFRIDERIIEYPWFFSRLPSGQGKLLDAGSVLNFDFIISQKVIAEKSLFISTLAPETVCFWRDGISYVYEDLRETCYRDNYFDWVVSLSTVEHIGLDNTMLYTTDSTKRENKPNSYLASIKEFSRVLKPGGKLYLSLPFGIYKNHGWFQVFDGKMIDELINIFCPKGIIESHFRYEVDGWRKSSREESKGGTCFDIHFQKTYDADYAAFSRAIICLEMVK